MLDNPFYWNKLRGMEKVERTFPELLERAGLTKAELARRLGLSARCVSGWGDRAPAYAVAYLEVVIEFNRVRP